MIGEKMHFFLPPVCNLYRTLSLCDKNATRSTYDPLCRFSMLKPPSVCLPAVRDDVSFRAVNAVYTPSAHVLYWCWLYVIVRVYVMCGFAN